MSDEESRRQMSKEFLLAEFAMLQSRLSDYESLKASRVNFLLIIVAAVVATVPTAADRLQPYFVEALLAVGVILLLLGVTTLFRAVEYSRSGAIVMRRAGRIRRWFVEQDHSIAPYVAFQPRDDRPRLLLDARFLGWRGGEGVLLTVNSSAAAVILASVSYLAYSGAAGQPLAAPYLALLGIVGFGAAWLVQILWLRRKLRRAEMSEGAKEVHFPYTQQVEAWYSGMGELPDE